MRAMRRAAGGGTMRESKTLRPIALLALLALSGQAGAGSRSIRVEFGDDWGAELAIGTSACPGTSGSNTRVLWNSFVFAGGDNPDYHFDFETYCQITGAYDPQDPGKAYFSGLSFSASEEPGLRTLVGANRNNAVTGIRYTYLSGPKFADPNGFQWALYFFPRNMVVVALNGLIDLSPYDTDSYILDSGFDYIWYGDSSGAEGYFCFEETVSGADFIGTWDGSLSDTSNECLRRIDVLFENDFED
jgi:hypothetical protein